MIKTSLIAILLFAVILCGVYPLIVFGIGQICFHEKSQGSLLFDHSKNMIIGSKLIGQNFQSARYFHSRPSAAGKNGYDASNSSGSNLGPTSQKLIQTMSGLVQQYQAENQLPAEAPIPVDAVTASGSGLDPHISLENVFLQVHRVAKARGLPEATVKNLVKDCTESPLFGILGSPRVNVLLLNLKLDETR